MLDLKPVTKIMFLDIETTSKTDKFEEIDEKLQECFLKRFKNKSTSEIVKGVGPDGKKYTKPQLAKMKEEAWSSTAPIFPEFGRILCISVGFLVPDQQNGGFTMRRVSFANDDEKILLQEFVSGNLNQILNDPNGRDSFALCAHNGFIFDFPFIAKRLIVNGIKPPTAFDYSEMKPWEIKFLIDLKKSWAMNVFDASVSLDTLASIFNIPSSKDDIDGSEVKDIYWKEKDLPRIVRYCEKDILCLARIYLKVKCMDEEIRVPDGE